MRVTAQQIFRDLDSGKFKPLYMVVGEEPFQADEIKARFKKVFVRDELAGLFNYEAFDGDALDGGALLSSLQTLPGLFDSGENSARLVVGQHFEKLPASEWDRLQSYFDEPSPTTCFLIFCQKADKRKAWFKKVDERGDIVEVAEPYDREWPKWRGYFERKITKKIETDAWELLLENSNRMLSLLWVEVQKAATFVAERNTISRKDLEFLSAVSGGADIFSFAEDVVSRRSLGAMKKYERLLREGESEIKCLSILVRQFRLVEHYLRLKQEGPSDSKSVAAELGIPPFFVSKIDQQAKGHSLRGLRNTFSLLAECDYHLKTGEGGLFELFLVPYFSAKGL